MIDAATEQSLRIWDGVAPGWEKHRELMNRIERPVTERMLNAVAARAGDTILELAAGPGEVGLELARQHPDANVVVSDFAPNMVEIAFRAVKERGLANVECRIIDAQSIDLPDSSVDGILSRYGLMLVPDVKKAFSEARRILKPGRTLAYVVWGPLETNPWMMVMGATLMQRGHFTPPPGGGFFPLTTQEENRAVTAMAGFDSVEVEVLDYPHVHESFESYWRLSTEVSGPLVSIVNGLSEEERRAVHDQVQEYSAAFRSGDRYEFPSRRIHVRAS
ncbi:MAG: class I SAM-dependent methyltransferase [Actinomycetota bacterium]